MALSDIVTMNITLKSSSPTQTGFGRALIAAYHSRFAARTKLYKNADDMLADGFLVTDQAYLMAQELCSQRPRPKDFKIGRRALPFTQVINLVPSVTAAGFVYSGKINGISFTYTVLASATTATISTALATLIGGLAAGVTASGASTTWCACTTTTPGKVIRYTEIVPELQITDVTADPGIVTDMAAILAADTDWFCLLLDSQSEAEVDAVAAWIETKRRIFCFGTADYGCKVSATTTDVLSDIKALSYFNTGGFWHHEVGTLIAAGIMGSFLVTLPGTSTVAHKKVPGVAPSDVAPNGTPYISDSEDANVQAKNGNTYRTVAGNGNTFPGKVASGDFFDATRFIHFMYARLQESVIGVLQNNARIPYSDAGIEIMKGAILNPLLSWVRLPYGALSDAKDEAPTVTAPKAADVDATSRIGRILPDVSFSARYLGAIHTMIVAGTVSL